MEYLPLQRGQNGEVMTQYAMKQVEAIGLVKFDFLGLKTLTVVDQAIQLIEKNRGMKVELSRSLWMTRRSMPCWEPGQTWGSSSWKVRG